MREPWVRIDPQLSGVLHNQARRAPHEAQESGGASANNSPSRERQYTGHPCYGLRIIPLKCDMF